MPLPITLYECCFFAGNVGPLKADNYCSRNQNKIFQHFGRLFLAGTLKNVPFSVNELLVKFREESTGVGRFCRLEFERMANWPSFDFLSKLGQLSRRPVSCNSPCFDKKIETGPVGYPLELRACKIGQSQY